LAKNRYSENSTARTFYVQAAQDIHLTVGVSELGAAQTLSENFAQYTH